MTELVWTEIRDQAAITFDELPTADTENTIIQHFQQRPNIVIALIDECAKAKHEGKARSAWAIMRTRLENLNTTDIRVNNHTNTDTAKRKGEAFIRNTAHELDWPATQDELFGNNGRIHNHPDLEPHMRTLHHQLTNPHTA